MAKAPRPWTVLPHQPLRQVDDNLWVVDSTVPTIPGGSFPRRMMVIRLSDGSLLLHNAIPLDDRGLSDLAALGPARIVVAPSAFHSIDVFAFKEKLGVRLVCPAASATEVGKVATVDGHYDRLPADPAFRAEPLDGIGNGEAAFHVRSDGGDRVSLVVCDAVLNIPHLPGFWGWMWKTFGFTGGPRCGPVWLKRVATDRAALKAHLARLAETPGLTRIVPSHGEIVERDAPGVLRGVAAAL